MLNGLENSTTSGAQFENLSNVLMANDCASRVMYAHEVSGEVSMLDSRESTCVHLHFWMQVSSRNNLPCPMGRDSCARLQVRISLALGPALLLRVGERLGC